MNELFGKNFLSIRNTHLLPRIDFGVSRKKYEHWSLKEVLTNRLLSIHKLTGRTYEIELSLEDYYKAIYCDVELFMNKVFVQYADFSTSKNISPTWSFVTLYYFAFFNATCLFRFLDKGFIFFTSKQANSLVKFSEAMYSDVIAIDSGNYYFSLKEINEYGNAVITLNYKGESVHKSTWLEFENTLRGFIHDADTSEVVLYKLLLHHFSQFKSEYPSALRNTLNYNVESSILDIENSIPCVTLRGLDSSFLKNLINLDTTKNNINQMNSVGYLASFLFELNKQLYNEFADRSRFGKDFSKERTLYLKSKRL